MTTTKDVIKALEIAEEYLNKGNWVDVRTIGDESVHMNIGTIHSNGFMELPYIIYTIRNGVAVKHRISI